MAALAAALAIAAFAVWMVVSLRQVPDLQVSLAAVIDTTTEQRAVRANAAGADTVELADPMTAGTVSGEHGLPRTFALQLGPFPSVRDAQPHLERWKGRLAETMIHTPPDGEGTSYLWLGRYETRQEAQAEADRLDRSYYEICCENTGRSLSVVEVEE